MRVLPPVTFRSQLPYILPCLADYLQSPSHDDGVGPVTVYQTSKKASRKQLVFKTSTSAKGTVQKHSLSRYVRFRMRILQFLGRIGGDSRFLLGGADTAVSQNRQITNEKLSSQKPSGLSIAWDTTPRVRVELEMGQSTVLAIFFDNLLPRIVELAEFSPNRQLKASACEFLHSIVLYMIGKNAQSSSSSGSEDAVLTSFVKLYEHIFPALVQLAVDVDAVTRQLFEPLVLQLTCWFTKNGSFENAETMALLDAIVEAVGNSVNGGLREFAARCLGDFYHWSNEHAATSSCPQVNTKSLFRRLYALLHHPDPFKRLGAASTFYRILPILKNDTPSISIYIFELLENILFALRRSAGDESNLGTADKICSVLRGLMKVIETQKEMLSRPSPQRLHRIDLESFTSWLFDECGRPEHQYRQQVLFAAVIRTRSISKKDK